MTKVEKQATTIKRQHEDFEKSLSYKNIKAFQEVTEASDKAKSKSFRDSSKRGGRERERERQGKREGGGES